MIASTLVVLSVGAALGARLVVERLPVSLPPPLATGMVYCAAGTSGAGAHPGFWIDRFEVTVGDYREFLAATGRKLPNGAELWSDPPTAPGYLPAAAMRLADARAYAEWRGKRLPTSVEWDWAARGPARLLFPWGDAFVETFANTAELDLKRPTLVGTFFNGRSQFSGAFDLVGNVAEWTESQVVGTIMPRFVVRGGSFLSPGADAMQAPVTIDPTDAPWWQRRSMDWGRSEAPEDWARDLGFRCIADLEAVARDERMRASFERLGARDPLGILFEVRPAMAELVGPEARRIAEQAMHLEQDPKIRERLDAVTRATGR